MIKLKNKDAFALISPVAQRLFTDSRRPFPVRDTFLLLDIVQQIQDRAEKIKSKELTPEELKEFEEIELEYHGEKLTISDDWPKLSVQEAMILKPLIKEEK